VKIEITYGEKVDMIAELPDADNIGITVNKDFNFNNFDCNNIEGCVEVCGEIKRTFCDGTELHIKCFRFCGEASVLSAKAYPGLEIVNARHRNVKIKAIV